MQLSAAGLALLEQSEGFSATIYLDSAGNRTIGYGHKLRSTEAFPGGISEAAALHILTADIAAAEAAVTRLVRVPLTQGQFDALVDFVFNLGAGRLESSTLLKDLNAKQYAAAASQLLLWDHSGQIELKALKARREAEYKLWTGNAPEKG